MLADFVSKLISLGKPNVQDFDGFHYTDKELSRVETPGFPTSLDCSTLQGLVDVVTADVDGGLKDKVDELILHVITPRAVTLISRDADAFGRRRIWAVAKCPDMKSFPFDNWLDPEAFLIGIQQFFQRVKIENGDGSFSPDLDYVVSIASGITAENAVENTDDGFAQRVAIKRGIALKSEAVLKPVVNLAPYRTFAEIDQVVSAFAFRARIKDDKALLALFEADGGRWKLAAVESIKNWLKEKLPEIPVIT